MDEEQKSPENQQSTETSNLQGNAPQQSPGQTFAPQSQAPDSAQVQPVNSMGNSQNTFTQAATNETTTQSMVGGSVGAQQSKRKLSLKSIPVAIGIALLVTAGSAAAYFGVIVPSKPENVLKVAFENTAKQTQASFDGIGKFESTDPDAEIKAFNIEFKGKADSQNNVYQAEMSFTASGVTLPVEVRKVDTSVYLRLGDVKTIQNLAATTAPEYAELIALVGDKISNQWIEIDETLLKQSGADCALNTSLTLSDEDIELLKSKYNESPFVTTDSTTSDTVDGRAAYKYELTLDATKANEFGKSFEDLSFVKALKECSDDKSDFTSDIEEDTEDAKIILWVDKQDKTISKIRSEITENEAEDTDLTGYVEITMNYDPITVDKPEGARPAMEIIGEIQAMLMNQYSQNPNFVQGIFDIQDDVN